MMNRREFMASAALAAAGCDNDAGLQKNIRGVDILADALRT